MVANAERLAAAVLARRNELDLTQLEVQAAGGPSNTTMTKVENAELDKLTRTTARRLDRGLGWPPDTARRVWDGEAEEQPLTDAEVKRLRRILGDAEVDEALREKAIRLLERGAG